MKMPVGLLRELKGNLNECAVKHDKRSPPVPRQQALKKPPKFDSTGRGTREWQWRSTPEHQREEARQDAIRDLTDRLWVGTQALEKKMKEEALGN